MMTGAGSIKALALELDSHIRVMTLYEATIGMAGICLRCDILYYSSINLM